MAALSRERIDAYTSKLNKLSEATQKAVKRQLKGLEYTDVADLRNKLIEILEPYIASATKNAGVYAADFYNEVHELAYGQSYQANIDTEYVSDATDGAVRGIVEKVNKGGTLNDILTALLDRIDFSIKRAAGQCVIVNTETDDDCIGYARVPSGAETCSFCLMLASFGAQYHDPTAAGADGHYHANCDCRIVPVYPGMGIEGYNPDEMYMRFLDCQDTLGGRWGLHQDFDALPEDERQRLIKKAGNKEGLARDKYMNKRIAKEIATRDPDWFKYGTSCQLDFEMNASPLAKELATGELLAEHGLNVLFRATRSNLGLRTPDLLIGNNSWEIKQPTGSGKRNISNQFNEAKNQSDRLIIDVSLSPWDTKDIVAEVKNQLSFRDEFKEVLLIKPGYIRRIKK